MAIAMRFSGKMSIGGGEPVEVKFTGVADTPKIWGGPPAYVDIGLPEPPPGIWGGAPPWVDNTLPGWQPRPTHPIVIVPPGVIDGVHPEHPIYLPVYPDNTLPPIPEEPPPDPGFIWVYTEEFGWVLDPQGGGKPRPLPPA
jgi:hypothetical protein